MRSVLRTTFEHYATAKRERKKKQGDMGIEVMVRYAKASSKVNFRIMELSLADFRINFNSSKVTGQRSKPNESWSH